MSKAWSEGQATESSGAESFKCDDPMACAKAMETETTPRFSKEKNKLVQSRSRPGGRKMFATSADFKAVMDRMDKKTGLFAQQWTGLHSLIANSENANRLSKVIKVFYGEMDHKARKKREELQGGDQAHPPQEKEHAAGVKATTFEDLQRSLFETARKIYECNKGVPVEDDEEKCRRAEEFLEEVLSEFNRMHLYLCYSTSVAELLDKSLKPEQAWELLQRMEESAEGDHQTRIQHQGDDPYSLKGLIASKRKQLLDSYRDRAAKALDSRMGAIKRCLDGIDFSTKQEEEEEVKHIASELRAQLRELNGGKPAGTCDEEYSVLMGLWGQIKTALHLQVEKMVKEMEAGSSLQCFDFDDELKKILPGAAILETLQRRLEIQQRRYDMAGRILEDVEECSRTLTKLLRHKMLKDYSNQQGYQYQELVKGVARDIRDLERKLNPIAGAFAEDVHDISSRCSALSEALLTMVKMLAGPQEPNQEDKLEVAGIMVKAIIQKLKDICANLANRCQEGD